MRRTPRWTEADLRRLAHAIETDPARHRLGLLLLGNDAKWSELPIAGSPEGASFADRVRQAAAEARRLHPVAACLVIPAGHEGADGYQVDMQILIAPRRGALARVAGGEEDLHQLLPRQHWLPVEGPEDLAGDRRQVVNLSDLVQRIS